MRKTQLNRVGVSVNEKVEARAFRITLPLVGIGGDWRVQSTLKTGGLVWV